MIYNEIKPVPALEPYIHSFFELEGSTDDNQWERIFPDGCPGIIINLGDNCTTDNGLTIMEHGKTYAVGAMTTFKESFMHSDTKLLGVCIKPGAFPSLFKYAPQKDLTDFTVEFDRKLSLNTSRILKDPADYLNRFFAERAGNIDYRLQAVLKDISDSKGRLSIREMAGRHFITVRQLERLFASNVGLSPKEYSNIIRFQHSMAQIDAMPQKSLSEIAFDCGYYDHAHLTNEIKKFTGLVPSQL